MANEFEKIKVSPNQIIAGRYKVEKIVGKGGMGVIAKVVDTTLDNTTVALKLLYTHLLEDKQIFARFRNEVVVARQLAHPNIIHLYDFGQDEHGVAYISMEYFDGTSLSKIIHNEDGNQLDFPTIINILREIAIGMSHAHSIGIIHRDIKPDNVLVNSKGVVKLTDLGLARVLSDNKHLTGTGEAVGTPFYMSPEVIQGETPDSKCDIYSFGIMAYEMATGKRPFHDKTWLNLARLHITQPLPAFVGKSKTFPKWFHDLVKKCTEKKKDHRYQSFDEILKEINEHTAKKQSAGFFRGLIQKFSRNSSKTL